MLSRGCLIEQNYTKQSPAGKRRPAAPYLTATAANRTSRYRNGIDPQACRPIPRLSCFQSCRHQLGWMLAQVFSYLQLHPVNLCEKAGSRGPVVLRVCLHLSEASDLLLETGDSFQRRRKFFIID